MKRFAIFNILNFIRMMVILFACHFLLIFDHICCKMILQGMAISTTSGSTGLRFAV